MASRRGLVDGKQRYKQGEWLPEDVMNDLLNGNKSWRTHFKPVIDEGSGVCVLQCFACCKLISAANPGSSTADHKKACKGPLLSLRGSDADEEDHGGEWNAPEHASGKRARPSSEEPGANLVLPPSEGALKNLVQVFMESEQTPVLKGPQGEEGEGSEFKRPRVGATQTPVGTRPYVGRACTPLQASGLGTAGSAGGSDDILEYLKGRGERMKGLEEEVSHYRSSHDRARQELTQQQERIKELEAELSRRGGAVSASAASSVVSALGMEQLSELERLLDAELAKCVRLEQELVAVKVSEAQAVERAIALEGASRAAAIEHKRELQELALHLESRHKEMKNMEAAYAEKLRASELELKLERRRRDTDQELHNVAQRQLQEARAELIVREQAILELQKKNAQLARHLAASQEGRLKGEQDSSLGSSALLSSRIQELERQLKKRDEEIEDLRRRVASSAAALSSASTSAGAEAAAPFTTSSATHELQASVRRLETELLECKQSLGDRDEQLVQLKVVADATEECLKNAEKALQNMKQELNQGRTSEQSIARKLASVEAERDSLRRSLAASSHGKDVVAGSASGRVVAAELAGRVAELEAVVDPLHQRVSDLEDELTKAAAAALEKQEIASKATEEARVANIKVARLEKEADSLARDVAKLQEKVGSGQVNKSSMRVLHLKMNPETELNKSSLETEVQELRAENRVLKEHLQSSRQSEIDGGDGAGSSGLTLKEAENAVLQHRLSELEKTMTRLKEVTKERITAFREACYSLFGYRVDMTSAATAAKDAAQAPTTFSLKPQHADGPDDVLVFRYTTDRGMELVPTPFSGRISREVDTFVRKFNCIPALTANLTMENFQKQTVC